MSHQCCGLLCPCGSLDGPHCGRALPERPWAGAPSHSDLGVTASWRCASLIRLLQHPVSLPARFLRIQEAEPCGSRQDGTSSSLTLGPLFHSVSSRALARAPGTTRSPARDESVSLVFFQIPMKFLSKFFGASHEFSRLCEKEPTQSASHLPESPTPPPIEAEVTWLRSLPTPARVHELPPAACAIRVCIAS